jgi:hypothetical protein
MRLYKATYFVKTFRANNISFSTLFIIDTVHKGNKNISGDYNQYKIKCDFCGEFSENETKVVSAENDRNAIIKYFNNRLENHEIDFVSIERIKL